MAVFKCEPQHNSRNLGHKDLETISRKTNMKTLKILNKIIEENIL